MRVYKMLYKGREFGTCHAESPLGALSVCAINAKHRFGVRTFIALMVADCSVVDILAAESAFLSQMAGPVKQSIVKLQAEALSERTWMKLGMGTGNSVALRLSLYHKTRSLLELLKCKP